MAERIKLLEQRQDSFGSEESPENTSLVTKQYPNYILPSGKELVIPNGVTLHAGGEIIGTVSGGGLLDESLEGDGINVVQQGELENFPRRQPRQLITSTLSMTNGSTTITGFTAGEIASIAPGMEVTGGTSGNPLSLPTGTTITGVDADALTAQTSNAATAAISGVGSQFEFAFTELSGDQWPGSPWFGETESAVYELQDQFFTFSKGMINVPTRAFYIASHVRHSAGERTGLAQFVEAADCHHMLGSRASVQALIDTATLPSRTAYLALLEWRGDIDQRPQTIVTDWSTNPPTLATNLYLMGVEGHNVYNDPYNKFVLNGVRLSANFSNLIVFIYTEIPNFDQTAWLYCSQIQLERGWTASDDYVSYGA